MRPELISGGSAPKSNTVPSSLGRGREATPTFKPDLAEAAVTSLVTVATSGSLSRVPRPAFTGSESSRGANRTSRRVASLWRPILSNRATVRLWADLSLVKDINPLWAGDRPKTPIVHYPPTTVHSKSFAVHPQFAWLLNEWPEPLIFFEDERHLGTGSHALAREFFVLGPHLMLFEDRVTGVVDREQLGTDGVTLGVPYAFRLLETNLHLGSFFGGSDEHARSD